MAEISKVKLPDGKIYDITAKNLSSIYIPFNRPVANGGSGKQWIKFAEVYDADIASGSKWYSKALEFEIFNNGYGSDGNYVSLGRVSLCVSVHNRTSFTKEAITIKWQYGKPNKYALNHIVAVASDTKVEFFVLNDIWDTGLTFVITRDIGISYGGSYISTQYTSDSFNTYRSGKKYISGEIDQNIHVQNSYKTNGHTVNSDVPANANFSNTTYTIKLSDDGKTLILVGSDGKTSSAVIGSGGSSGGKSRIQCFGDIFKIL